MFRVNPITGAVLGNAILLLQDNREEDFSNDVVGDGVYTNLLAVEADYVGQASGFHAVPVISGFLVSQVKYILIASCDMEILASQ